MNINNDASKNDAYVIHLCTDLVSVDSDTTFSSSNRRVVSSLWDMVGNASRWTVCRELSARSD